MLTAIELTDYRAHSHTTVPLERFTLLVGENATGKTSVLEAVHLIGRWLDPSSRDEPFAGRSAPEFLRRHGVTGPTELAVAGAAREPWRFAIRFPAGAALYDTEYSWSCGAEARQGKLGELHSPSHNKTVLPASVSLTPAPRLLSLDPRAIARPAASDELTPVLEDDGSGLATVLKNLGNAVRAYTCVRLAAAAGAEVPRVLVLAFDTDGRGPEERCEVGVASARQGRSFDFGVVVAEAHPEFDAWGLAGFEPAAAHEARTHHEVCAELGMDPTEKPHALTSTVAGDPRDAKLLCVRLLHLDGQAHPEDARVRRCVLDTSLERLMARGAGAGIAAFVDAVIREVLPLLGDARPAG